MGSDPTTEQGGAGFSCGNQCGNRRAFRVWHSATQSVITLGRRVSLLVNLSRPWGPGHAHHQFRAGNIINPLRPIWVPQQPQERRSTTHACIHLGFQAVRSPVYHPCGVACGVHYTRPNPPRCGCSRPHSVTLGREIASLSLRLVRVWATHDGTTPGASSVVTLGR